MMHTSSWKHCARRLALLGLLGMGTGCDSGAPPAVETVAEFEGALVLTKDEPTSGGSMTVSLRISPPDEILAPDDPVGGPLISKAAADIHFETHVRYTGAVLGGRSEGESVPYLNVSLRLTNRDSGKSLDTTLIPHVGIAEGYHYARNLALVDTLDASEAGYDAEVTITAPAQFGDPETSAISPGIVMRSDIAPSTERAGTVLGPDPIVVSGGFILGDFKNVVTEEVGGGAPAPAAEEPGGGY